MIELLRNHLPGIVKSPGTGAAARACISVSQVCASTDASSPDAPAPDPPNMAQGAFPQPDKVLRVEDSLPAIAPDNPAAGHPALIECAGALSNSKPSDGKPLDSKQSENVWEIALYPSDTQSAAWRDCLLTQTRTALEKKLQADPAACSLTWKTPLGTIEVRPREDSPANGRPPSGGPLRLAFAPVTRRFAELDRSPASMGRDDLGGGSGDPCDSLPSLRLPDDATFRLGQRLVGLEAVQQDILLRWRCQWDGTLGAWERKTGCPVPPALQEHLQTSHVLWLLHGDPGLGKSALARTVADAYCRQQDTPGTVLWLTTQLRGQGLVGDFSRRLRTAFRQLRALPEHELKLLIIDEADALALRRSEGQSHQEDKAATSTLIQCLDETVGLRRAGVILTTNTQQNIDAAIQRRAHLVGFERPCLMARHQLLAPWLPQLTAEELDVAALAAEGMTPADMERALGEAWLAAIDQQKTVTPGQAATCLQAGGRTGTV